MTRSFGAAVPATVTALRVGIHNVARILRWRGNALSLQMTISLVSCEQMFRGLSINMRSGLLDCHALRSSGATVSVLTAYSAAGAFRRLPRIPFAGPIRSYRRTGYVACWGFDCHAAGSRGLDNA